MQEYLVCKSKVFTCIIRFANNIMTDREKLNTSSGYVTYSNVRKRYDHLEFNDISEYVTLV